jgi:DNA-binding CsgD family transcriptional regulator
LAAEVRLGRPGLLGRGPECEALDRLLTEALAGRSGVLVLRGDPGVGKSRLLGYLSDRVAGWQVASAVGVESEMELAYSGLHQLCGRMLDRLDRLPGPQRDALATVFGRRSGPAPDQFLVGLATLTLLAEVAEEQPLVCIVDDADWLDLASAQILSFVARRLNAERVALVCAARPRDGVLAGLPELVVGGLDDSDARALLLENVHGPLDAVVLDQIVTESHGNPLALLELPRTWNAVDLAGGFGLPGNPPVVGKIEQSYARRLVQLPAETQLLVLAAAAEPLGDPVLLHRAAEGLGLDLAAAGPAEDSGLLKIGGRVEFAHPLVRSAAYRSAAAEDRYRVHRALALASDPETDPERRIWHRARGTSGFDDEVAAELELSAARVQARGGLAASAAFLERAAELTPEPHGRAQRMLAAARAKRLAGQPAAAAALVATALQGPLDGLDFAMAQRLRGQIGLDLRRGAEAAPLLLDAAKRLEPLDGALARETYLEALWAASTAGRFGGGVLEAAEAARAAPPAPDPPTPTDLLLEGLAAVVVDGFSKGAPILKRALARFPDEVGRDEYDVRGTRIAARVAVALFDDEAWSALATHHVQIARETGLLSALPITLGYLAALRIHEGKLEAAATLLDESDSISVATGNPANATRVVLAASRGDEGATSTQLGGLEAEATARGDGVIVAICEYGRALLHNGLGQYATALGAAQQWSASDGVSFASWLLPELIEAAIRTGAREVAVDAYERLAVRTRAAGTDFALGTEARSRALISEGAAADDAYREAIELLDRTRIRLALARAHLVYGEWLRRESRRVEAREQLRIAHEMFTAFGTDAFAERARRELIATGEKVRKRSTETRDQLTPQEEQIAQLARNGLSNPEIGAMLYLSPRTVEWHLRKVFAKLGINSRSSLRAALANRERVAAPA